MFKKIVIIIGSVLAGIAIIGAIFFYLTGGPNPEKANDLRLQTAYMAKNTESYARCYNSINHGTSLIGDVRLRILSENFYDDSVNSERLDVIEKSFMGTVVNPKCQSIIADYETAYKTAIADSDELQGHKLWNFFFGASLSQPNTQDLNGFESSKVRMSVAFNDYVFTEQEVKSYFDQQLGL
jgi:hypothetical protein